MNTPGDPTDRPSGLPVRPDLSAANGPASRRRALVAVAAAGLPALGLTPVASATAASMADTEDDDAVAPGRALRFPRDHGAHLGAAIEWWYATGQLGRGAGGRPLLGFQVTFFRSRTPVADQPPALAAGRFAPRHLLFAHAAITDLRQRRHRHAQRLARWSGEDGWPEAGANRRTTHVVLGPWRLWRDGPEHLLARIDAPEAGFTLALECMATQPLLLQGHGGFSQKGPSPSQASHYYSQPHLRTQADLRWQGEHLRLAGSTWLDHEWSHSLLPPDAVGWDWIGIHLDDGGALTAFVLRRADGQALWAGGSHRPAGGAVRTFAPAEVRFTALRHWTSPDTGARYPVQWRIDTPLGSHTLQALLDAQELDSRSSTGTVYWEGLAELRTTQGQALGVGYLEMTGRAGALRLGR